MVVTRIDALADTILCSQRAVWLMFITSSKPLNRTQDFACIYDLVSAIGHIVDMPSISKSQLCDPPYLLRPSGQVSEFPPRRLVLNNPINGSRVVSFDAKPA